MYPFPISKHRAFLKYQYLGAREFNLYGTDRITQALKANRMSTLEFEKVVSLEIEKRREWLDLVSQLIPTLEFEKWWKDGFVHPIYPPKSLLLSPMH